MAERKGEVFVDERAIIVQLRRVWGVSDREAGAHFTCRLADSDLEAKSDSSIIRQLFPNFCI